jgi:hypothetical protein
LTLPQSTPACEAYARGEAATKLGSRKVGSQQSTRTDKVPDIYNQVRVLPLLVSLTPWYPGRKQFSVRRFTLRNELAICAGSKVSLSWFYDRFKVSREYFLGQRRNDDVPRLSRPRICS